MKPIYLEIEGLQSYRNLQKIDFNLLTENGLFGIFGSTGSGKSTVLDAITLALYGKVSRASRGTQGIMNNECDRMRVMFEFSLLQEGNRTKYRIERVFARKNENGIDTKTARMFAFREDGMLPIAEKATDIDGAVKELIGLEYEDFTRAVVLPQNKFQEFLSLEKSKKLSMLERLFGLNEYGEKLTESVKVKIYELEKEFENIKGQLSAIEHSDDSALQAAQQKFDELSRQKDIELAKYKTVEEEYLKVKDLYETSVNVVKMENELKDAVSEKDYFDRLKSKVSLSVKAKEIEPLWESYKALAAEIKNLEKSAEELVNALSRTVEQIEKSEQRNKIAAQNAESSLPALYDKKSRLEQGVGLQEKFDLLTGTIAEKEQKAEEIKTAMLKTSEQKNKNQIRRSEISGIIGGYDEFFKENKPKLAHRSLLIEGQKLENDAKIAETAAENAKAEVTRLKGEKEKLEADIAETEKAIAELSEKHEKRKASVESTINQYKSFKADYMAEKARLEKEVERLLMDETAYHMAQTLEDASPCPVCGSMHHPAPAKLNQESAAKCKECKEEIARYEQEIEDADRIILGFTNGYNNEKKADVLVEIEELTREIGAKTTRKEILSENLKVITEQLKKAETVAEGAIKLHFEKNNIISRFMAENNFGEIAGELAALDDIEKNITETESEILGLRKENDGLFEEFNTLVAKQSQLETELAVALSTAEEQKQTLREVENQISQLVSEGTIYEEIDRVNAEINLLQKEREESAKQLENLKQTENSLKNEIQLNAEKTDGNKKRLDETEERILAVLEGTEITSPNIILQAKLSREMETNYNIEITRYEEKVSKLRTLIAVSREKLAGKTVTATEYDTVNKQYEKACGKRDELLSSYEVSKAALEKLEESNRKWKNVSGKHKELQENLESLYCIKKLIAGNKFVEYVAEESLRRVLLEASDILSSLTHNRYRLELGADSEFVVKDYLAGGSYRGVATLSGGETFLTSLSLAVALSKQIQLKGRSPLEFFFLDEGFGSLDGELLDTVITALEALADKSRVIGVVSHLKELQERIPGKLYVTKDEYNSSRVEMA